MLMCSVHEKSVANFNKAQAKLLARAADAEAPWLKYIRHEDLENFRSRLRVSMNSAREFVRGLEDVVELDEGEHSRLVARLEFLSQLPCVADGCSFVSNFIHFLFLLMIYLNFVGWPCW